jgi:S1-C subfamily serine protease
MIQKIILGHLFILFYLPTVLTQSISDILENSISSVVTIAIMERDTNKQLMGYSSRGSDIAYKRELDLSNSLGTGSGFIIRQNGKLYIITNAHVVEQAKKGENSIVVYTINQKKYRVKLVGGDTLYDFAVLSFIDNPGSEISEMQFSKEKPRIGQRVFAIGNPLGEYPYSISDGIISALNRSREGIMGRYGFIQTTATLIYGNSGGPLINEKGEVVGINSQIAWSQMSNGSYLWQSQINFSLASDICIRLLDDILDYHGVVQRSFIGLEVVQNYKVSFDWFRGASEELIDYYPIIKDVIYNNNMDGALVQIRGCIIREVNEFEIRNLSELLGEFEKIKPGSEVSMEVTCNENKRKITFKTLTSHEKDSLIVGHFLQKNLLDGTIKYDKSKGKLMLIYYSTLGYDFEENIKYEIVGLGQYNKGLVWRVSTMEDFAAALRLLSVYGNFDLVVKKIDTYGREKIDYLSVELSGSSTIRSKTLFY